jgi:hypothetical protein
LALGLIRSQTPFAWSDAAAQAIFYVALGCLVLFVVRRRAYVAAAAAGLVLILVGRLYNERAMATGAGMVSCQLPSGWIGGKAVDPRLGDSVETRTVEVAINGAVICGGFVIADRRVVTAWHCIRFAEEHQALGALTVQAAGGAIAVPVRVADRWIRWDVAALVPTDPSAAESLPPPLPVSPDDPAWFGWACVGGAMSGWQCSHYAPNLFFPMFGLRLRLQHGDSGSPVIGMDGKVIGIVSSGSERASLAVFTPLQVLRK